MRSGLLFVLPVLSACPSSPQLNLAPDGGFMGSCQAQTPGAALYSAECNPPQDTTFCLVAETTAF